MKSSVSERRDARRAAATADPFLCPRTARRIRTRSHLSSSSFFLAASLSPRQADHRKIEPDLTRIAQHDSLQKDDFELVELYSGQSCNFPPLRSLSAVSKSDAIAL